MLTLARDGFGILGNAQHATATARHGMRPSVPLVVSTNVYLWRKAGLKRFGSQDRVDRQTDGQTMNSNI